MAVLLSLTVPRLKTTIHYILWVSCQVALGLPTSFCDSLYRGVTGTVKKSGKVISPKQKKAFAATTTARNDTDLPPTYKFLFWHLTFKEMSRQNFIKPYTKKLGIIESMSFT